MKIFKTYIVPVLIVGLSVGLGFIFNDYIWGAMSLAFGFLNAYYMAIGKWQNYIFGFLFSGVYAYICWVNGLFGLVIFTCVFYFPLGIYGVVNWFKNKAGDETKMRSFNWKTALIMCSAVIVGSVGLGFLLTLIPGQNLAFLDSTSQIINLCGFVLSVLRFRESWYIWLVNNVIDFSIWIINTVNGSPNAIMSLITAIMYFIMNIIGLILWIKLERKQKNAYKTNIN